MAQTSASAPADTRVVLDDWLFRADPDDVGLRQNWHSAPIVADEWRKIRVPGTWEGLLGTDYDGIGWYRTEFELPALDDKKRGLCFMGVDDTAEVFVNGMKAPFELRIGKKTPIDLAEFGRTGANTLAVRVVDTGGPGGLVKPVYFGTYERLDELCAGEHHAKPARTSPDWVKDAVIYEMYLRSFTPEGTLKAAMYRLDTLVQLGASVIWLMPIQPVGKEHRKGTLGSPYAVQDYYAVNPEFGTLEDLREFVRAAHQRGQKVILDWVANHTAWDCKLVSEHPDWFARDKSGKIRPPVPDWSDVAQLDYSKPGVRAYMTEAMLYWVREADIDGFRCDVAGMVPLNFWEELRPRLDAAKPVMMLAEDDDPAQHLSAFDMTYDWHTYDALKGFGDSIVKPGAIAAILSEQSLDFPAGSLRMRFGSNHDKNAWDTPAATRYGPEGVKTVAALIFTMPGIPLIYNGDEIGNATRLPLFEKTVVDWEHEAPGMRALYESLTKARREHASLRRGEIRFFDNVLRAGVLGFTRFSPDDITFVVLNLGKEPRSFNSGNEFPPHYKKLLGNFDINAGDKPRRITAPAFGYWVGAAIR
ncbi:MAG: alpha-amylase family glycosyl hydrolase [Phycisphaerae bacterium]